MPQPPALKAYWERRRQLKEQRIANLAKARAVRAGSRTTIPHEEVAEPVFDDEPIQEEPPDRLTHQKRLDLLLEYIDGPLRDYVRENLGLMTPPNGVTHTTMNLTQRLFNTGDRRLDRAAEVLNHTRRADKYRDQLRHALAKMLAAELSRLWRATESTETVDDASVFRYSTSIRFLSPFGETRSHVITRGLLNNLHNTNLVSDTYDASDRLNWSDTILFGSDLQAAETELDDPSTIIPEFELKITKYLYQKRWLRRRRGGLAPWRNTCPGIDLTRFQIEGINPDGKLSNENCFVYALRQSGRVSDDMLGLIASKVCSSTITLVSMRALCNQLGLSIRLTLLLKSGKEEKQWIGPRSEDPIRLALYKDHFFLNDSFPISQWVLDNAERASAYGPHPRYGWCYKIYDDAVVASPLMLQTPLRVIEAMETRRILVPIPPDDTSALRSGVYSMNHLDKQNLAYVAEFCPKIEFKERDRSYYCIFADFETTTDGDCHRPYMLCARAAGGFRFVEAAYGDDADWGRAINQFVWWILNRAPAECAIRVYFHNFNYDMAFLLPHLYMSGDQPIEIVEVNKRIISARYYSPDKGRRIDFCDSYTIISSPLRDFGKMFNLDVEKEVFPYDFYTRENFKKYDIHKVPVDEYLSFHRGDSRELCERLEQAGCLTEGLVDANAYSLYYCERDCEVLRRGFEVFREQLREVTDMDCCSYLTLPSIAYNYLIKCGVFEGCHNLCAQPQYFIRRCVLGGRCMLSQNQKQYHIGNIADFDAVSLYPSAMERLYTLQGLPKIIEGDYLDLAYLREHSDGFFVEVEIGAVPVRLDFPLLAMDSRDGLKHYANVPGVYYMDDISLANVQQFHGVPDREIKILRGYYYNEGKNYTIREVVRKLFDRRNELKAQKNPLEKIYKLLMNSCYGKSIIKPIEEQLRLMVCEKFERELAMTASMTLSYRRLGDRYLVYTRRDIVSNVSFPSFGAHVLAMSKRIMSEVMCTAQELGINIFYTDTDSVHLRDDDIKPLAEEFKRRFGRELIGKDLGQFHTDFPNHPETGEPSMSRCFIGVGKKCYIDELETPSGAIFHHIRLKGIPEATIREHANQCHGGDLMSLYQSLYMGKAEEFDLLAGGRVSFQRGPDLEYTSRKEFRRRVKF